MRGQPLLHPLASRPSPAPLDERLVASYRLAETRVSPGDWAGLRARVDAASDLARHAFVDGDRAAWELAQLLQWRLHRRGNSRPSEPGDVLVLDAVYRIEGASRPAFVAPRGLSARAFCEQLARDVAAAAHTEPSPIAQMCRATLRDWRYIAHNMLAEAWDFTRLIALASLPLPHRHSRLMYHNLYDEAGRGVWERAHFRLFVDFVHELDIPVPGFDLAEDDDDELLYWSAPEVIAEINVHKRALWHPEPGHALGAMFIVEHLVPADFAALVTALRGLGVPDEKLAYFQEHVEVDGGHASDWITVVEEYVRTPEEQQIVYASAMESARWFALGWEGLVRGWNEWSRTGVPPHLPARELRETFGPSGERE